MERRSFTVNELCDRNHISRATYYRLKQQGKGPRTFRVGNQDRISLEAETSWLRMLEAENDAMPGPRRTLPTDEEAGGKVAGPRAKRAATGEAE